MSRVFSWRGTAKSTVRIGMQECTINTERLSSVGKARIKAEMLLCWASFKRRYIFSSYSIVLNERSFPLLIFLGNFAEICSHIAAPYPHGLLCSGLLLLKLFEVLQIRCCGALQPEAKD